MALTGDDCYFYYYSTCVKGDDCPFRHQPAALGCELTCHLWEKGRCFKRNCSFRHMVIEKDRRTIQCVWENQPSGCMKPHCPFLHTKQRNIPTTQPQAIPNLGTMPPRPPANVGQGGPGMRPPMYMSNPARPNMPPSQAPFMGRPQPVQQRPMRYDGYIPQSQPSNPFVYQMHHTTMASMTPYTGMMMTNMMMNQPRANYIMPGRAQRDDYDDSDDDYTSSDYSDVSLSDDDERRTRSRESSSRRKVQSPRSSNRREVRQRSDRDKKTESRSSRESYNERRSRRRHESDRERTSKDSERNRTRPRKQSENKESTPSSSTEKRKDTSEVKIKSDDEDKKEDIKVKTLEEILREKALKNLHERTALKKKKLQMEAEKVTKEADEDSPDLEPILKSVVSVSRVESTFSQKVSESREPDDEVEFIKEKRAKSPKKIILIDNDNETTTTSTSTASRQVKVKDDDTTIETVEDDKDSESSNKPTISNLSNIKVKTFEEIMEEKRQRKALGLQEPSSSESKDTTKQESVVQEDDESDQKGFQSSDSTRMVSIASKLTRRICVVKKDDKEPKTTGKLVIRRKVEASPVKGAVSKSKKEDEEEQPRKVNPTKKHEPTKNIIIKSFDEIMKEKQKRKELQTQPTQETTVTTTTTAKRPTIIRKKHVTVVSSSLATKETTTNAPVRNFKPRKLKVISRIGVSSTRETLSQPGSPSVSNPVSPTSPQSDPTTPTSPSSHQDLSINKNDDADRNDDDDNEDNDNSNDTGNQKHDNDDSDDDSWEHEELPAVPLETPTLEGPAQIPHIPQDCTVLHIPGKVVAVASKMSPIKRPRSSLEEIFGVPCDDMKQDKNNEPDDEDNELTPAKKAKTNKDTYDQIVDVVNNEMHDSKDDFDLELEEELANLPADKSYSGHDTLNEDDLLLELEEMINN